ncbi:MAG: carbonic anhydrase family protein [Cyanobacteria bacterium J06623_7]
MQRRSLLKFLSFEAIALTINPGKSAASQWTYQGKTGTDYWGEIAPEFQTCGSGQAQSPINIEGSGFSLDVGRLDLNYQDTPLVIVNNGRTIRVDYEAGSSLTLDEQIYELIQFHFHQPSEHLIAGKAAAMEAHFVHRNSATGDLVVLAVLMAEGKANRVLESIWQRIPPSDTPAEKVADITINALQLLPENSRKYYRYQGSLTTPPCSEIVTWLVLKQPVTVSKSQLTSFKQIIGNNARPVQALNQRLLQEFD